MLSTLLLFIAAGPVSASLSGSVGPITSYTEKAATKVCNIVDYGASTNGSDMSTALTSAWDDCLTGGLVYIPPGNWSLAVFPELKDGVSNAVQLDGVIHRTGSDGDQMLSFRNCQDFEFFSGNSKGALQGYGYEYLADGDYGPRMMRFQDMGNFSIHGIAIIDSPSYYLTLDTVSNGEIYNIIMRGPTTIGATDAIDVWGDNVWVHDIEATNGDECVTVKSPSSNFLIESIYCNLSGGNAIGSLSTGTDVHDITYRHIYANGADPSYVKSSGGNGTVKNILWENVIVRDAAYPLAINSNWESTEESADGVFFTNFTYRNWHGYNSENARPIIRMECPSDTPCTDITFDNVNLWSADSSYASEICWNAYGTGKCLRTEENTLSAYTSSIILTATPSYSTSTMPNDFTSGFAPNASFTIPPIPTTFFPGQTPSSALLDLTGAAGSSNTATRAGLLVGSSATPSAIPSTSKPIASSWAQVTSPISSTVPHSSAQITGVSAANLDEPSAISFGASASSSAAPSAGVSSADVNPAGAESNSDGTCVPEIPAPRIPESATRHAHQHIANHRKGHGSH